MESNVRIIEVNGQKFEVDMREARKIEAYRVGNRVKVLVKASWGETYATHPGVIVGIDGFQALPTIVVAYMPNPLSGDGKIEFAHLNAKSKDVEIVPMTEDAILPTRETMLSNFARAIQTKQKEIDELAMKRDWFLKQYGLAYESVVVKKKEEEEAV